MSDREIKNAIIDYAHVEIEDHGTLTVSIGLDYGGLHQGFGGYALYLPKSFSHHRIDMGFAGHFIYRVMELADVKRFDELKGKTVRADCEWGKVHGIGHIVKDDWFYPDKDFEPFRKKEEKK